MKFEETALPGAFIIEQSPFRDERGEFARTFCMRTFQEKGLIGVFVQTNHVRTVRRGTIRGLHFQAPPAAEAKLIRCVRGAIQDVMVDLRRGSPTFLRWHSEVLTPDNLRMIYCPPGFAHGFQTLEAESEATYQVSAFYTPHLEGCIRYNDPLLDVAWAVPDVTVSPKDAGCPFLTSDFGGLEF
jgi:dTDP-4-dehydrorhamnose 3,5-epimerase